MTDSERSVGAAMPQEQATIRSVVRAERVVTWAIIGASVSLITTIWKIGLWANHWYIVEQVYYPQTGSMAADVSPGPQAMELLRTGNEALLTGFVWLGIAVVCVVTAVLVRRRYRSVWTR